MEKNLQPHELAAQLRNTEYEVVNGRVESTRLGSVLRRLERIDTYGRRYQENEHGYTTVHGLYRGLARDNESYLVGASVVFHDPIGDQTELGGMQYVGQDRTKATASVQLREGVTEPLLPEHEAWDVIVGTITNAVDEAWIRQFGSDA